jgi:hypothetical protein
MNEEEHIVLHMDAFIGVPKTAAPQGANLPSHTPMVLEGR